MTSLETTKETQSGISPISDTALHPLGQCWANATTLLIGGSKRIVTTVLAKSSVGVLYLMFSLLHTGFLTHCSVHSCATVGLYNFHYWEDYFTSAVHWDSGEDGNSSERHLPFSAIYFLEHNSLGPAFTWAGEVSHLRFRPEWTMFEIILLAATLLARFETFQPNAMC